MNRNKGPLVDRAHIASAVLTLYEIVKLLRLDRKEFERMFSEDVTAHINSQAHPGFVPYAEGLRDAYMTAIIKDHCEFVYYVDGVRLTIEERISQGGGQSDSISGYQWKGTEYNFSAFLKEVDVWI